MESFPFEKNFRQKIELAGLSNIYTEAASFYQVRSSQ